MGISVEANSQGEAWGKCLLMFSNYCNVLAIEIATGDFGFVYDAVDFHVIYHCFVAGKSTNECIRLLSVEHYNKMQKATEGLVKKVAPKRKRRK